MLINILQLKLFFCTNFNLKKKFDNNRKVQTYFYLKTFKMMQTNFKLSLIELIFISMYLLTEVVNIS